MVCILTLINSAALNIDVQPKSPSVDPSKDQEDMGVCTMEYCSAIKNKILPHVTWWLDKLEGILLSEISQAEENKYCMLVLLCEILKTKQKQTKYGEQTSGY